MIPNNGHEGIGDTDDADDDGSEEGGLWCVGCGARTPGRPPGLDEMKGRRRDRTTRLIELAANWRCGRCLDAVEDGIQDADYFTAARLGRKLRQIRKDPR